MEYKKNNSKEHNDQFRILKLKSFDLFGSMIWNHMLPNYNFKILI